AAQAAGWIECLVGVDALDLEEDLDETSVGVYIDPFDDANSDSADDHLFSAYDARNVAAFGQVDGWLSERWGWSFGLRGAQRTADYRDSGIKSGEVRATDASQRDRMWGGQAPLHFDPSERLRLFTTVSRGYKAGGFNLG